MTNKLESEESEIDSVVCSAVVPGNSAADCWSTAGNEVLPSHRHDIKYSNIYTNYIR